MNTFDTQRNAGLYILLSWPLAPGPVSQSVEQRNSITRKLGVEQETAFCSFIQSTPEAGGGVSEALNVTDQHSCFYTMQPKIALPPRIPKHIGQLQTNLIRYRGVRRF